ncbi:osmotically-inducible protein OsmY [Nakamurella sp. UYEF19]|uniref:BON domain-containing protein n=1 Tax=Nakamurella sp. UYEF19 TaxID=1756392 RepID=UPI003393DB4B
MTVNLSTTSKLDGQLKHEIDQELERVPGLNSTRVGVAVDTGTVTLSGEVDSFLERRSAADAVLRLPGVNAVAQEITVRSPFVPETDADIASEAGQALNRATDVPDTVRVSVTNRRITLTGTVQFSDQSEAAGRTMHHITGATGVLNEIRIRDEQQPEHRNSAGGSARASSTTPSRKGTTMSPYENRLALVESALKAEKVHPAKGKTLAEAAATVLAAIDEIRENVR